MFWQIKKYEGKVRHMIGVGNIEELFYNICAEAF